MASKNKFNKLFYWFYKKIVTPIIIKNNITVIRTVEDDFIQRRYGISLNLSSVVGFGSDLYYFKQDSNERQNIRKSLNIDNGDFVVIYAGKLDESKGGQFLADSIFSKFECEKKIIFLILGNFVGEYGKYVKRTLEKSENKIIIIHTQPYIKLAKYFQASDIAIFPKQCSLTFYDVQACGLPVVLELNSINEQRIAHGNGVCFKKGDSKNFRDKIKFMVELDENSYKNMSCNSINYVVQNYNYNDKVKKYNDIIEITIKIFDERGRKL